MANITPIYEPCEEIHEIVCKLAEKHSGLFWALDPSCIRGFEITNKERPESKRAELSISGASGVFGHVSPIKYVIVAYSSDWTEWKDNKKVIEVAKVIKRISEDGNGKLNKYDEVNHLLFLATFGLGYEDSDSLPNLLTDDVDWQVAK